MIYAFNLVSAGKLEQAPIHCEVVPGHIIGEDEPVDGSGRRGRVAPLSFTALAFPALDDQDDDSLSATDASQLLGNDFAFLTAFLTAFLFNWIGFLLLMCFCHTIAAR